jgi:hypothetical protein
MHMQVEPNYMGNPVSKMSKRPKNLYGDFLNQPNKLMPLPLKLEPLNLTKKDEEPLKKRAASGLTYPDISLQL